MQEFVDSGVAPNFLYSWKFNVRQAEGSGLEAGFRQPTYRPVFNYPSDQLEQDRDPDKHTGINSGLPRYMDEADQSTAYQYADVTGTTNKMWGWHFGDLGKADVNPIQYAQQHDLTPHFSVPDPLQPPVVNPDYIMSVKDFAQNDRTKPFRKWIHESEMDFDSIDYSQYPNQGGEGCEGGGGGGGGGARPDNGLLYPRGDRC